jgi:hypothetical protein
LTDEQREQLDQLERDMKDRLKKILTADQLKKLSNFRPSLMAPGGPGQRGPGRGGPPDGDGPPERPDSLGRPPEPPHGVPGPSTSARSTTSSGAIAWFATWESGLREAQRSGRPILLVSAAPHCAGVPGVW